MRRVKPWSEFQYVVTVKCETQEEADQVMCERILHEEEYGFNYLCDFKPHDPYPGHPA